MVGGGRSSKKVSHAAKKGRRKEGSVCLLRPRPARREGRRSRRRRGGATAGPRRVTIAIITRMRAFCGKEMERVLLPTSEVLVGHVAWLSVFRTRSLFEQRGGGRQAGIADRLTSGSRCSGLIR